MKKFLFTLLVMAGLASAVTNTVVVEPSAYGYFTGHTPGTYTYTVGHAFPFVANEGYVAVPTLNGKVVNSSTVTVAVASTNGFYRLGVKAYYIRIEDTVWSRQSTKPAGTYYNVGTGIWTRCFWTSQTENFGGCTVNGVSVSPVTDNWYFISAPTSTNKYFRAVKASYSVTLAESANCCMFSPTNGTYSTGTSFTFKVTPNADYCVQLKTNNVVFATLTKEQTITFPVKANTAITASPKTARLIIEGGPYAQAPCNTSTIISNAAPKSVTVAAASGYAIYQTKLDGKVIGDTGTFVVPNDGEHTLSVSPVTIMVSQNPVGTSSPNPGVYTNGVTSFTYSCTSTNSAAEIEGVYFGSEKLTATGGVYTVKATKPNTIWVKSSKFPPSPSVPGVLASVSFAASGSWQYLNITDPADFDPTTGQKLLPHYGDAVMIQALGGDIDIAQSTNFTSTVYTKTAPYQLELSPITVPDGNTLVINKPLPGLWFKGSGNVTISTIQR